MGYFLFLSSKEAMEVEWFKIICCTGLEQNCCIITRETSIVLLLKYFLLQRGVRPVPWMRRVSSRLSKMWKRWTLFFILKDDICHRRRKKLFLSPHAATTIFKICFIEAFLHESHIDILSLNCGFFFCSWYFRSFRAFKKVCSSYLWFAEELLIFLGLY